LCEFRILVELDPGLQAAAEQVEASKDIDDADTATLQIIDFRAGGVRSAV
jgi:hypothetical protein